MTYSHHTKVLKQIGKKPAKVKKYNKHNVPKERSCGVARKRCKRCLRIRGHIQKYGLNLCRQCFREIAKNIGFTKFN